MSDTVTLTLPLDVAVKLFHVMWALREDKLTEVRTMRVFELLYPPRFGKPDSISGLTETYASFAFERSQIAETVMDALAEIIPLECLE